MQFAILLSTPGSPKKASVCQGPPPCFSKRVLRISFILPAFTL
ncbi:MAG: hypothetical protein PHE01_02760 [Methanosarcina sp.]|nr:hypothetical protein [Methanosarcina sp.]